MRIRKDWFKAGLGYSHPSGRHPFHFNGIMSIRCKDASSSVPIFRLRFGAVGGKPDSRTVYSRRKSRIIGENVIVAGTGAVGHISGFLLP